MIRFLYHHKKSIALCALFACVLFILPIESSAQTTVQKAVDAFAFSSIRPFASFAYALSSSFLAFSGGALDWTLRLDPNPSGVAVVRATWDITRDFANMFFIVALIVMAFATIFDIGSFGYGGYDWRSMLTRFIIVAVMINFSLAIGQLIINISQIFSGVFLQAIGDAGNRILQSMVDSGPLARGGVLTSLAALFGQATGTTLVTNFITSLATSQVSDLTVLQMCINAFVFFWVALSMFTGALIALIRVPVLWFLLIVSPLAWVASIFPRLSATNTKWWSMFIGWNTFLPIYLFFLYLGLYILQAQAQVLTAINPTGASILSQPMVGLGMTFQELFFYAMTIYILWGGVGIAIKGGGTSGAGAVAAWSKARTYATARFIGAPVVNRYDAAKEAVSARAEQFKQEGFQNRTLNWFYGGKDAQDARTQQYKSVLGVRGSQPFSAQKDFSGKMDKAISALKDQETAGKMKVNSDFISKTYAMDAGSVEGAARRALLYERGMITDDGFKKDLKAWVSQNPFLAETMIDRAQKGSFKNVNAKTLLEAASAQGDFTDFASSSSAIKSRQKLYNALIGDKDIPGLDLALSKLTPDQIAQAVDLMGGKDSNEAFKFGKAVGKKRLDALAQYQAASDEATKGPGKGRKPIYFMYRDIKNKKASDLADLLDPVWNNGEFQNALRLKIKVLDKVQPGKGPGVFVPSGVTLPPGAIVPKSAAAAPQSYTDMPGGTVYHNSDFIFDTRAIKNLSGNGVHIFKGALGGGSQFKNELKKSVSDNPSRLRIVQSL